FRIAAHDAQRQEDREDDAEEQRAEHRHPEQECGRERVGVDAGRRYDVADVVERVARAEPVEGDERDRQHAHDDEDLAAQRLAQTVLRDRERRLHCVSPPTASTYTSSSVDVRTRAPYTFCPSRTSCSTRRGTSSRPASSYVAVPSSVSISTPRGVARSAGVPAATTRPASKIATRSQTSSTSLSRCEFSRTETPRRRSSSSNVRTVRRPTGSSALVGSSRRSSCGFPTSACAMPRRCCIPFDISSTCLLRASARPTSSSSSSRSCRAPSDATSC